MFEVFDVKRNGVIEFGEFVRSLSVFHPNAPLQDKVSCEHALHSLTLPHALTLSHSLVPSLSLSHSLTPSLPHSLSPWSGLHALTSSLSASAGTFL